jgi:hypothetical protein
MIIPAPLALALWLTAQPLIGTELGWLKRVLAIAAATGRRQCGSSGVESRLLRRSDVDIETAVEYVLRPGPWQSKAAATGGGVAADRHQS